jgi:hypothetical protein
MLHTNAVYTFITRTTDLRITEIAGGIVSNRGGRCRSSVRNHTRACVLGCSASSPGRIHLAIATKNGVNDDPTGLFNLEELMERVVFLSRA